MRTPSSLRTCLVGGLLGLLACAGGNAALPDPAAPSSGAPPATPPEAASTAAAAADPASAAPTDGAQAAVALPTACADKSADVCTPSSSFVDRLCTKPHQDAALALFASGTPFSRMYLKGKMDELAWDEEVLALRYHPVPKGGMQVGGAAGSYDVLRWDGSCSMAVDADMLTKNKPPRPRTARLKWHRIGDRSQTALIAASETVKKMHARRGKECQGAMSGDVSSACEKADGALGDAIVEFVRGGGAVPRPDPI